MVETLDSREKAPLGAHRDMYNDLPRSASERGGYAVGVPGEVKGLYTSWEKYGSLPWKELVEPAINFARNGYKISPIIAERIAALETDILNCTYGPGMRGLRSRR